MMLHLRPAAEWSVPVLLTEATAGTGVSELLDAVMRHRGLRQASGAGAARSAAARQEEFVAALREEIARRIEAGVENGRFAALLGQVTRGEIDPYRAALQVLNDDEAARALLGQPPRAARAGGE
jgi:LAO/AO transport system kinase